MGVVDRDMSMDREEVEGKEEDTGMDREAVGRVAGKVAGRWGYSKVNKDNKVPRHSVH